MAKITSIFAPATLSRLFKPALFAGAFLYCLPALTAHASDIDKSEKNGTVIKMSGDETATSTHNDNASDRESIFGGNRPLDTSHFTWGADLGASVDLTAHDMSTFDLDFIVGYKNSFIKTAGIGAGIHRTVQGGDHFIPVYALIRTSFISRPSLLFLNARFGYSFNTIEDSPTFGDFNSALGCGINLSQSSKAKTYIIISAAYRYFNKRHQDYVSRLDTHSIWMAQLQFGVNF